MSERLTEKGIIAIPNKLNGKYTKEFVEVYKRLMFLEDILEKHGIESVEELDMLLAGIRQIYEDIKKVENDRDTWKKSCKLMGKTLKYYTGCSYCSFKNQDCVEQKPICEEKIANYFYQQAKESEDEE